MGFFGLTPAGSDVIGVEKRGELTLVRVLSNGVNKSSAVRSARQKATPHIPFRKQDVVNTTQNGQAGIVRTRYIVTVSEK